MRFTEWHREAETQEIAERLLERITGKMSERLLKRYRRDRREILPKNAEKQLELHEELHEDIVKDVQKMWMNFKLERIDGKHAWSMLNNKNWMIRMVKCSPGAIGCEIGKQADDRA